LQIIENLARGMTTRQQAAEMFEEHRVLPVQLVAMVALAVRLRREDHLPQVPRAIRDNKAVSVT